MITGLMGEVFAAHYLLNEYPLLSKEYANAIRKQVEGSPERLIRNLFYGEFKSDSPFIPHILDERIKSIVLLPEGVEIRLEAKAGKRPPFPLIAHFPKSVRKELISALKDLATKRWKWTSKVEDQRFLLWELRVIEKALSMSNYIRTALIAKLELSSIIELLKFFVPLWIVLDYVILRIKINQIYEEDNIKFVSGKIHEVICYEVKAGKAPPTRRLGELIEAVENFRGCLKVRAMILRVPLEINLPRSTKLEVISL